MPQMNMASGCEYNYPEFQDYIRKADVVSVQIGSNDAFVPCIVALGNATNWKSEQLVATMVSGVLREPSFEHLQRLNSDLSRLRLTREEKQATTQLLLGGGTDAICEQAYQEAAVNMPQVVAVAELRQPPPAQQPAEHTFLRFDGPAAEPVDRPFALRKPRPENYTAERHFATQLKMKN